MLYSHEQLCIHIYMQKHIQHNKDVRHSSLEKYTSHFIERVVCERGLETEQRLQHFDPHSYGHNSVSFPFSWAAQPGPGGPSSLGRGPHFSIFSPTATAQSGVWGPPLLGAGSLYCNLSPTDSNFLCTVLYYCFTPTQFNLSTGKVIPLRLRPDAPVVYTGAFPILTAPPGSICNTYRTPSFIYESDQITMCVCVCVFLCVCVLFSNSNNVSKSVLLRCFSAVTLENVPKTPLSRFTRTFFSSQTRSRYLYGIAEKNNNACKQKYNLLLNFSFHHPKCTDG